MKTAIFFLAAFVSLAVRADDLSDVQNRVAKAAATFDAIMMAQDRAIPDSLLKKAQCVAVFPSVIKAGFIFGGTKGKGLVSCRTAEGWSRPLFLKLAGGSVG
ncbi:MAG: lipid-binding SYLF domain-containing protein, partial [Bdellovibrionia bacterium]